MLFNSYPFILAFLPISLTIFFWLGKREHLIMARNWLAAVSLFFYAWWDITSLPILVVSVLFNYFVGMALTKMRDSGKPSKRYALLCVGVMLNLAWLGYFKYATFSIDVVNYFFAMGIQIAPIALPIGVSFFTFQQIAYLVDTYRNKAPNHGFMSYLLFVTFFPHLIAGPLTHPGEMIPQFSRSSTYRFSHRNVAIGITIFAVGLAKKVLLADSIEPIVARIFVGSDIIANVNFADAWAGTFAYAAQLYFDFSGYSDMAIGLGRVFGIRFPINFYSPYKSTSIIDFWRRWHISLSKFLRDYLYFALGGNRKGPSRRHVNLLITMLLGGLWHGAGINFIIWGGLHGLFLVANHGFRNAHVTKGFEKSIIWRVCSVACTFTLVCIAWVFFRASTFDSAIGLLKQMLMVGGMVVPEEVCAYMNCDMMKSSARIVSALEYINIALCLGIAFLAPNTFELFKRYRPALDGETLYESFSLKSVQSARMLRLNLSLALITSLLLMTCFIRMSKESRFIYFQF
jgi:alginate O-acetyltransferase complex protein AlgI